MSILLRSPGAECLSDAPSARRWLQGRPALLHHRTPPQAYTTKSLILESMTENRRTYTNLQAYEWLTQVDAGLWV